MVGEPGSLSDSGFHRGSLSKDVKIKTEPGIEALLKEGLTQTCENEGSTDRQSFGRGFGDKKIKEEDRSHGLEENP